jgi:ABC-type bacteriocin/lantibiotic exporter with double-glycine peptidase domain
MLEFCIERICFHRGKTRVLVTHGISFLPFVDNIVVMKDGMVSEEGSFKELLAKKVSTMFLEFGTKIS